LAIKQLQFQEDLPNLDKIRPSLPEALTPVLRRGTALNPAMRPPSVMALMNDLEQVLAPKPVVQGTNEAVIIAPGRAAGRPAGRRRLIWARSCRCSPPAKWRSRKPSTCISGRGGHGRAVRAAS